MIYDKAQCYPPWSMGPERPVVMLMIVALLCLVLFVAFFVPLTACTLTNDEAHCAPPVVAPVLPSGPVTILGACPCNASLVIRNSPNARQVEEKKRSNFFLVLIGSHSGP